MEINHRPVSFPEGVTVHRAAELNGIYIPSLCSHKDLSPFGGCRLCMVEIEGMRGYPLSCNTTAREGMKVLTDTADAPGPAEGDSEAHPERASLELSRLRRASRNARNIRARSARPA